MAVIQIGGVDMPSPSGLRVEIFDVGVQDERSASGLLVVDRVAVKRRLTLTWAHLSPGDLAALLTATGGAFFSATYPDPELGTHAIECRCGARRAGVLRMDGGEPVWTDVSMEWVER